MKYILLMLVLILTSCAVKDKAAIQKDEVKAMEMVVVKIYDAGYHYITEVKIDGCYYFFHNTQGTALVHKANCPNHIYHTK